MAQADCLRLLQIAANCPCYNTGGKWWKAIVELSGLIWPAKFCHILPEWLNQLITIFHLWDGKLLLAHLVLAPWRPLRYLYEHYPFSSETIQHTLSTASILVDRSINQPISSMNSSICTIWQIYWINIYLGPLDLVTHNTDKNFINKEFKHYASTIGINMKRVPVKAHNFISMVK